METSKYFVDTSALFKRYIPEKGTDVIDRLMDEAGSFIISNLSIVECISNFKRLTELEKRFDSKVFSSLMENLFADIGQERLQIEPVTSKMMVAAVEYISEQYIAPIDAIQLAVLKILNQGHRNIVFVCADKKLCDIAEKYGFPVIMPT